MQTLTHTPPVPTAWHSAVAPPSAPPLVERLPFTVRVARSAQDLAAVAALRARAYGRHLPQYAQGLQTPEPADQDPSCCVLMAESRTDGRPLGTMRLIPRSERPLQLEDSVSLPPWLKGSRIVEGGRLCIELGAPPSVRWALLKASYLHCRRSRVDWIVLAARRPLDRVYEGLLFRDLLDPGAMVPMKHVDGVPHRVMGLSIHTAPDAWAACGHPMRDYMLRTPDPDIRL